MADALSRRVLVLNRLWQAVNIVSVKRAFSLLAQEHASVVCTEGDQFQVMTVEEWIDFSLENPPSDEQGCIHTVRMRIRIPSVLLLKHFDRIPSKEVKFSRQSLFERDGYTCQYCGQTYHPKDLNMDHVIPKHMGGKTTWENIVTSCIRCNSRKADRLPHQAGMFLRKKPSRPKWRSLIDFADLSDADDSWNAFLYKS